MTMPRMPVRMAEQCTLVHGHHVALLHASRGVGLAVLSILFQLETWRHELWGSTHAEDCKTVCFGTHTLSQFALAANIFIFRLVHIYIYMYTDAHTLCLEKPWVFMDCILQKSRRCQIEEGRRKFCRSPCDSYHTQDHFGKLQICAQSSTTVTVFRGVLCHALIHHIIRRWPERFWPSLDFVPLWRLLVSPICVTIAISRATRLSTLWEKPKSF